ncbi:MAG: periplasmic heavy metal sensor [Nitrospirota bacterium]
MKRWKAVLGIIFIFLLGAIAGGIISSAVYRHRQPWGKPHSREQVVRKLSHKLNLDANQRAQVEAIVNDAHNQMRDMRRAVQPKIDSILTDAQAKIRAVLRTDQKQEFNKLVARWKERREKTQEGN